MNLDKQLSLSKSHLQIPKTVSMATKGCLSMQFESACWHAFACSCNVLQFQQNSAWRQPIYALPFPFGITVLSTWATWVANLASCMAVSLHTPQNCDDMMQKHNKHLQAVSPTSSELFNCSSNLTTWQMKPQKPTKTHTVGHSPPFWLRIARSNIHQEHPVNMCRPLLSSSPSSLEAHCVELGFPADPRSEGKSTSSWRFTRNAVSGGAICILGLVVRLVWVWWQCHNTNQSPTGPTSAIGSVTQGSHPASLEPLPMANLEWHWIPAKYWIVPAPWIKSQKTVIYMSPKLETPVVVSHIWQSNFRCVSGISENDLFPTIDGHFL